VTGFFGMNTAGMPFEHDGTGTVWAIAAILASISLAWWLLRRGGIL
jgi:zinc transporter